MHQFLFRGFEVHRHHVALNELGYVCADHVGAKECSALCLEDYLDEPLILAHRYGLAVADEGEPADPDFELLLPCTFFRQSNRGDLRRTVRTARNEALIHGMRPQALNRLDANHS